MAPAKPKAPLTSTEARQDANKDGVVSAKEHAAYAKSHLGTMDTLNSTDLAKQNGISKDFITSHPEILGIFQQAINEDWVNSGSVGFGKFSNAIQASAWGQENDAAAQKYLMQKQKGGAVWETSVRDAQTAVQKAAVKLGATLDANQLAFFADQYQFNGWDAAEKAGQLEKALSGQLSWTDKTGKKHDFVTDFLDYKAGGPQAIMTQLRGAAESNGIKYDDSWYTGTARSIAGGFSTIEDHMADIREHAATSWPVYADKIRAGVDVKALASPYMQKMADLLEINPQGISLNDSWIKKAMGGVDAKGTPTAMGLWDFEKQLRTDPRWQHTKNANDEVSSMAHSIIQMFGFGG